MEATRLADAVALTLMAGMGVGGRVGEESGPHEGEAFAHCAIIGGARLSRALQFIEVADRRWDPRSHLRLEMPQPTVPSGSTARPAAGSCEVLDGRSGSVRGPLWPSAPVRVG